MPGSNWVATDLRPPTRSRTPVPTNKFIFNGLILGGSGGSVGTKTLNAGGAGNIDFNGAVTRGNATSLTLVKSGTGTLKFNNSGSKIGQLTLNGGTIDLAADMTIGDQIAGGTQLNGSGGTITSSGGKLLLGGGASGGNGGTGGQQRAAPSPSMR